LAARTKTKVPAAAAAAGGPLDKKDEIVANVIWRFLELRGYVSGSLKRILLFKLFFFVAF
jgi:hypothetical protein